ncbi:MAG: hypothetical protein HEQ22_03205 [Sphingopyxis sp.]|uniref:hypothetical protein n=1 Tax=Sphingopyxis sp. TaxID=1908224 RepID=UPI003D80C9CD
MIAALGAIFGGIFYLAGAPLRNDMALCDAAIMATLKAPATYRRVPSSETKGSLYRLEYDAENSFGVPLRGQGYCSISEDGTSAEWLDLPDSLK